MLLFLDILNKFEHLDTPFPLYTATLVIVGSLKITRKEFPSMVHENKNSTSPDCSSFCSHLLHNHYYSLSNNGKHCTQHRNNANKKRPFSLFFFQIETTYSTIRCYRYCLAVDFHYINRTANSKPIHRETRYRTLGIKIHYDFWFGIEN